jgi:(R,R)-butanediol dehydrogenase/meso-butanediol dehydrogenase/diacetyl reductase
MLAVVLTELGEKGIEERRCPTGLSGHLVLRVEACGVCGSNVKAKPIAVPASYKPEVVLGHEFTGPVIAGGDDVRGIEAGQLVVANVMALCCGACTSCRRGAVGAWVTSA